MIFLCSKATTWDFNKLLILIIFTSKLLNKFLFNLSLDIFFQRTLVIIFNRKLLAPTKLTVTIIIT
jgi:hypothetical protein